MKRKVAALAPRRNRSNQRNSVESLSAGVVVRLCAGKREGRGRFRWMLGKVVQRCFHFKQKFIGHCLRETVADENALDHEIFAIGRHRVGRDQPAAQAQSIGVVVEREA
jgi:hypothetical protein